MLQMSTTSHRLPLLAATLSLLFLARDAEALRAVDYRLGVLSDPHDVNEKIVEPPSPPPVDYSQISRAVFESCSG